MIMGSRTRKCISFAGVALLLCHAAGCGSSGDSSPATAESGSSAGQPAAGTTAGDAAQATALPTASVGTGTTSDDGLPAAGTPERLLFDIEQLRTRPLPQTQDMAELRGVQLSRNEQIVELATEAIARTHDQKDREEQFNEAVHHLMEARLQLALQGQEEHIDLLYNQAESLYRRDPKSQAAIEAARVRVRFAHTNAMRFADREPKWLQELAQQARTFAANFPQEDIHAVELLYAAGRSCELHGLTDEAIACYSLITRQFGSSRNVKAAQVPAILRRLQLPGQPLELAGPEVGGKFVRIEDFRGKAVLVVFWASGTPRVHDYLPAIREAQEKLGADKLSVIGVNLDEDELALETFVERNGLNWPQIFHTDPSRRRWDNPVARFYGLRDIPAVWLIDAEGIVVSTTVTPEDLVPVVSRQVARASR